MTLDLNAHHALDYSLGFILLGTMLNIWLYGFSVVQTYLYFVNFPNDKRLMRIFIAVLFVADTLHTALCSHFTYFYLVSNFGDLEVASVATHTFSADPILTSAIAMMAQGFFAWRIWKLTSHWWISAVVGVTAVISFLSSIGTTIGVEIVRKFAEFQKFQVAVILWLACAALCDIIITSALIATLNKSRTGFQQTDDIITKLIRLTLQTGLLTAGVATIDLILFVCSTTTAHLLFNLPLAKLYVNSLMSTLNARAMLQDRQRYTMNTSSTGGATKEAAAVSGVRNTRHSRFVPTASNNTVTENGRGTSSFFRKNGSNGGGNGHFLRQAPRDDVEGGIHIMTIEERYEDPAGDATAIAMLPQVSHAMAEEVDGRRYGAHPYGFGAQPSSKSVETADTLGQDGTSSEEGVPAGADTGVPRPQAH
ncbi:hypothetical protein IE81DRAFT_117480 [Ceraceosorus guamensis]|uniref:DUF6534 domain-containing protein n=1 Tax=Ceraceosorus guamensis TaxID=1522189 RepID=A0A316VYE7_9BASI|nr:hypothetical protein IE81DRAFT_117480 [Ceraceosorus guamensis]PWN42656.1 hypothetical protein IE81DRAFT_117480 [Ceraceosorus guamensis]